MIFFIKSMSSKICRVFLTTSESEFASTLSLNFIFIPRYLTSATRQPENGILIRPFEGDPSDTVSALNSSSQNFQHLSAIPSAKEQFEKFPKFGMKEHHWYIGKTWY